MATEVSVTVNFAIPEEEVELTPTILGEGGFATVYKAKWKGAVVAVKCIRGRFYRDRADPASKKESEELLAVLGVFRKEVKVSCGLLHPRIVRLFGVYAPNTRHVGLVMELMETSLRSRVKKEPSLATPCIVHVLHDMTSALTYLHSRKVLHRDISPGNILLSDDSAERRLIAKLSDFATAKAVETIGFDSHTANQMITFSYLPAEAIDKDPLTDELVYSSAVDVYSVGAVGLFSILRKDPGGTPVAKPKYLKLVGTDHVLYGVLKKCLEDDPRKRPASVTLLADLERVGVSETCTCSSLSGCGLKEVIAEKSKVIGGGAIYDTAEGSDQVSDLHCGRPQGASAVYNNPPDGGPRRSRNPIYQNVGLNGAAAAAKPAPAQSFSMDPLHANLPRMPPPKPSAHPQGANSLETQDWFHGPIPRDEAEQLLEADGEFLVRESTAKAGQYVLSGMENGQVKHFLLVDPDGVVRTGDRVFETVHDLIYFHIQHSLPVLSSGSSLTLDTAVVVPMRTDTTEMESPSLS